jgi:integrase
VVGPASDGFWLPRSARFTGSCHARGVPLEVVSDILGHSSIAITGDVCGHVSPDVARQAIEMLGDALDR